jgi:hypothetical protein
MTKMSKETNSVENAVEEVQVPAVPVQPLKTIFLNGLQNYKDAIVRYRQELGQLIQDQVISEQTAQRLLLDAEYSFFQQMISVEYK